MTSLQDIVNNTPSGEEAVRKALEGAARDQAKVRKQNPTSLTIDGKDVKLPSGLGEYTTAELEAELKQRQHEWNDHSTQSTNK